MNKIFFVLNSTTNQAVFCSNTRLVPLTTRRYDSRYSKVKPKLRPKSNLPQEDTLTLNKKIRVVIALGIFTAWFAYIGVDLIKTGYKYITDYRTSEIKQVETIEDIVEFKLPFGKKSKKEEIDYDK